MANSYVLTPGTYTTQFKRTLAGETVYIEDCIFDGSNFVIRGYGHVVVKRTQLVNQLKTGSVIVISGTVDIDDMTIVGLGAEQAPGHRWSGFNLDGVTGGTVKNVEVSDFLGNAFLIEASHDNSVDVDFRNLYVMNCGSGMWFAGGMNDGNICSGHTVMNFVGCDCYFNPNPRYVGCDPVPCLRHGTITGDSSSVRVPGDTVFTNVNCDCIDLGGLAVGGVRKKPFGPDVGPGDKKDPSLVDKRKGLSRNGKH